MRMTSKARLFLPVLATLLLADCTTKDLARTHLVPSVPEEVVGSVVRFTLAYNPGAAMSLSLGPHSRIILSVIAVIAVLALTTLYRRTDPRQTMTLVALAMVMAGALGNLLDRLRSPRGVVDFIDLGVGSVRFFTFNIADIGVFVGALLLAWRLSRDPATEPS